MNITSGFRKSGFWFVFGICLLFVLAAGCASDTEKKAKHVTKAREYIKNKDYKAAVIELKNAVRIDPRDDAALYELGETYGMLGQGREAYTYFFKAAQVNPENVPAQLKLARILLIYKESDKAREKAEIVLAKDPENLKALLVLAGTQIQQEDPEAAGKTLEKALKVDPERFQTQLAIGRLHAMRGEYDQAEKSFLSASSLAPEEPAPHIELTRLYGRIGAWDKAEAQLRKMIAAAGATPKNLMVIARFYEERNKHEQAEKAYLEVVAAAVKDKPEALANLGNYYARRGRYNDALKTLDKALALDKENPAILNKIAELQFELRKFKEADATVDRVLTKDHGNPAANLLKGRLYLLKRDFANALDRFGVVIGAASQNGPAYYYKALALIGQRKRNLAQQALLKAIELNPGLVEPRLILAEFYLHNRDREMAGRQLEYVLEAVPEDFRAYLLMGNLKILERNAKGAEAAFRRVLELQPDFAPARVRLGLLYWMTKRTPEAVDSLQKALALDPGQRNALTLLVQIYLKKKDYKQALEFCQAQKKAAGENKNLVAYIEYLEGRICLAQKEFQKAEACFEKSITINANALAPYVALAGVYFEQKKVDEAVRQFETILKKNPKYLAGYMALGTIYERKGDLKKAEKQYRKTLEIKRNFGPAANNLAWVIAQGGGNVDEALGYAQVAKEQLPRDPNAMDTLGWIYYLKGSYLNAISELRDSLEQNPDNAIANYHLGLAYYKRAQNEAAVEYFEKALHLDKDFQGAEEAQNILEEIKREKKPGQKS